MEPDNETASDRSFHNYENIAAELEQIAEMVRNTPGLNQGAAERLRKVAGDIRSDLERSGRGDSTAWASWTATPSTRITTVQRWR